MDENFSFGYWLKRQRLARDLRQAELARQLGIAPITLRKIEADERRPSLQLIARVAEVFQLNEEDGVTLRRVARADLSSVALRLPVAAHGSLLPDKKDPDTAPTPPVAPQAISAPAAGSLPSGAVTFLFTDIEGSTQLWERHSEAMRVALTRHNTLLQQTIANYGGSPVKNTGDGILAAFAAPDDGLRAALAAQRALLAEHWSLPEPLRVRMALHTGPADPQDGDYVGPTLNRVARLLAAGYGGQILVSVATAELLYDLLPSDVQLRELGVYRLKNLRRFEPIFQVEAGDLPGPFPPLRALDARPRRLPPQTTPLIGRVAELNTIDALFSNFEHRLTTITGPGGMGKSRLALAVAERQLATARFPDGAFFVELAPIDMVEQIATTIADTLDLPLVGGAGPTRTPRQQVIEHLRSKRLLLILDNCEHLLDGVRDLATAILAEAPEVVLLATSRERLNLRGEQLFPLGRRSVRCGRTFYRHRITAAAGCRPRCGPASQCRADLCAS